MSKVSIAGVKSEEAEQIKEIEENITQKINNVDNEVREEIFKLDNDEIDNKLQKFS